MFGYIRPMAEELKVKDYALYRAAYCGLCRSMGKNLGLTAPMTLRYDFVFLALVRMVLTGEVPGAETHRCAASPYRKKTMLSECDALAYAARCAGMLTLHAVEDNIADEHGVKRLLYRCFRPTAGRWYQKSLRADAPAEQAEYVKERLLALAELESGSEPSPDAAAQPFADLLGALFASGLEDEGQRRIARACGTSVGRFVYLIDAVDDAIEDEKTGSYNPVVIQARNAGLSAGEYLSRSEHAERLRCSLLLSCEQALRALQLADGAEAHPAFCLCENILTLGMPRMAERVITHPGEPLAKTDPGRENETV